MAPLSTPYFPLAPARVIPHGKRDHPGLTPNRRTYEEVPMSAPDTRVDG
jgi:hypothetical protein